MTRKYIITIVWLVLYLVLIIPATSGLMYLIYEIINMHGTSLASVNYLVGIGGLFAQIAVAIMWIVLFLEITDWE